MNKYLKLCFAVVILFIVFFIPSFISAEKIKLKVTIEKASVRDGPSLRSVVLAYVAKDRILESDNKVEEYYSVSLPPDKNGVVIEGYIHSSLVTVVIEKAPRKRFVSGQVEREPKPPPHEPGPDKTILSKAKPFDNLSFGLGLGFLYASIGVSVETSINEYLNVFGAIGLGQKWNADFFEFWKREKVSFSIGARFYPLSLLGKSFWIKPRLGVSYGYNGCYASATYSWGYLAPHEKNQNGINVSFGSDIHIFKALKVNFLKNLSFDSDVMIPITRSGYIYTSSGQKISNIMDPPKIYLSYGIRYNIDL